MKTKAVVLLLTFALFGCRKDHPITITGPLTDCPAGSACTYAYYDRANSTGYGPVTSGDFRVFLYQSINNNLCGISTYFSFKTSLSNADFDITTNQIAEGQVHANDLICPCCEIAWATKPIGGEIKGKRTDNTHWLVNATIIFGRDFNQPTDTLKVNQYFVLTKVP